MLRAPDQVSQFLHQIAEIDFFVFSPPLLGVTLASPCLLVLPSSLIKSARVKPEIESVPKQVRRRLIPVVWREVESETDRFTEQGSMTLGGKPSMQMSFR